MSDGLKISFYTSFDLQLVGKSAGLGDLLVKGADFNAVIQAKKDRNQGFVFRDEEKSSMKKQIFKKALASLLAAVMIAALMPGSGAAGLPPCWRGWKTGKNACPCC